MSKRFRSFCISFLYNSWTWKISAGLFLLTAIILFGFGTVEINNRSNSSRVHAILSSNNKVIRDRYVDQRARFLIWSFPKSRDVYTFVDLRIINPKPSTTSLHFLRKESLEVPADFCQPFILIRANENVFHDLKEQRLTLLIKIGQQSFPVPEWDGHSICIGCSEKTRIPSYINSNLNVTAEEKQFWSSPTPVQGWGFNRNDEVRIEFKNEEKTISGYNASSDLPDESDGSSCWFKVVNIQVEE